MHQSLRTHSARETRLFGEKMAETLPPGALVAFQGDLGAGKTTLIQGLLKGLGATGPYPSPTFVLMHQYELPRTTTTGIRRVYHADAYRVGAADFRKLGFDEWLADPVGLVLLEWPERVSELLPKRYIQVTLRDLSETQREILVEKKVKNNH